MSYQLFKSFFVFNFVVGAICNAVPSTSIPEHLYSDFTLNGSIPVVYMFRDDSYSSDQALIYTEEQIQSLMVKAQDKQTYYYGATDIYLYEALEKYRNYIFGKNVGVMGSVIPWYESILLSYGAKPITIDYNKIISLDPRVKAMTVLEYNENPILFDAILSISSFEHDGLGRYGDTINPFGDLEAMKKTKSMLKKEGLLFLSVPVGQDLLVWNLHRIYGKIRLTALLNGWQVIGHFGYTSDDLNRTDMHQPVFVLKPSID